MPSQAQLPLPSGPTGGPDGLFSLLVLFLGLGFEISSIFPFPYFYNYQSISPCDGRCGPTGLPERTLPGGHFTLLGLHRAVATVAGIPGVVAAGSQQGTL